MFEDFRNRMGTQGKTISEVLKKQSDMVMDATFSRSIGYRLCYIQDKDTIFPEQTLEGYKKAKSVFLGRDKYNPKKIKGFKSIEAKYMIHNYTSLSSDAVDYYLQFRPLAHGKNPNIKVGAFIFVPDDLGVYNLWMIVNKDDRPQFPKYYILKCNLLLKWFINNGEVPHYEGVNVDTGSYFQWTVQRTQSSYNSGVWTDYRTTSPENQLKAIVQTNPDTDTISYNEVFVITTNSTRRISWEVSKVESTTTFGLTKLTFIQRQSYDNIDNLSWINPASDVFSGRETGYKYDYYLTRHNDVKVKIDSENNIVENSVIIYSGISPTLTVGGGYKTITANLKDSNSENIDVAEWVVEYYKDNNVVCNFILQRDDVSLAVKSKSENLEIDNGVVKCVEDEENIFEIKYLYNPISPNSLKLKCMPIYSMSGNKIKITSADATIIMEVNAL